MATRSKARARAKFRARGKGQAVPRPAKLPQADRRLQIEAMFCAGR